MLRLFTFLDEAAAFELTLPVTPPSYEWTRGSRVETVQLDQLGDINLPGSAAMGSMNITALLPARLYPFCSLGAAADPDYYIDRLNAWCDAGAVLRFIISGTGINYQVLIESVSISEKDGTNDVYAAISLRQYRRPDTAVLAIAGGGAETARDASAGAAAQRSYTTVDGDTLWSITERFYGDGGLYRRLAAANSDSIKNPNIIWPGMVLSIPPMDELPAAGSMGDSEYISTQTHPEWSKSFEGWQMKMTDAGKAFIEHLALARAREVSDAEGKL